MTEEKKVALSENEEVSAVDQYFKNRAKKRKKTIISIIAVALAAIVAVSVLWFYAYRTEEFVISSIKWGTSQKMHKLMCRADFIGSSDDGNTLFYNYRTIENGLLEESPVHYSFKDGKLNEVSVIINSGYDIEFNDRLIDHFKMKNVSFSGTSFYAEYNGYHVYYEIIGNTLEKLSIKSEIDHDESVKYPSAEDVRLDSKTRKLVSEISRFMLLEYNLLFSGISGADTYKALYGKFVNYTVEICKALEKYPENVEVMDCVIDLMQKREEINKKGQEIAESLQGTEQREFATWMIEQLNMLYDAYELIPDYE